MTQVNFLLFFCKNIYYIENSKKNINLVFYKILV